MNSLKGELEYGLISLDDKEDYRLYRYSDVGMGETEYRIFRNGNFFAMFDNRKDAETAMTVMMHQSHREKVLELLRLKYVEFLNHPCPELADKYDHCCDAEWCGLCTLDEVLAELRQAGEPDA